MLRGSQARPRTLLGSITDQPFRILVICTGNRARSQMAHGWLEHLGGDRVTVASAGTVPNGVHPIAIRVMAEVGIDISAHTSDPVERYLDQDFDLVITVCDAAREQCPVFPGANRLLHHAFEDPDYPELDEASFTNVFRRIRDEIGEFSRELLAGLRREQEVPAAKATRTATDDVTGSELVEAGLADLKRGELTIEALLVAVGAPRLRTLGMPVPQGDDMPDHPELALYKAVGRQHPDDAHSRYNALIRRLVSYERELERRRHS